ncbi:MAG: SUMF1/EgtB/PvdO family nonheme iron enzyme [Deltaproteobacteria bacterium]|nr:SUMF1/EgtB/PvdO family nonheme iron enzyme [Deltaproteobacteria bacterium]
MLVVASMLMALTTCVAYDDAALPPSHVASISEGAEGIGERVEGTTDLEPCPLGMAAVTGSYCPDVEHKCLRWLDPPGKYHEFRCAEYATDPVCRAPRRAMRFCIDRDEQRLVGAASDPRPSNNVSWVEAKQACAARGARLCTQSEWQFACEGAEMRPYPYGFVRDSEACNIDHFELGRPGALRDLRTATGGNPRCASPFGVLDLAGNLEEWVTRDPGSGGKATLLKGSWWMPGRSTCRATNAGHDEVYHGAETGFRCCR